MPRRKNRGVSQVIAALVLIAIAVAAAVLLYVYSLGVSERLGTGGGQQVKEGLILAAYRWSGNPGSISGTIKNVGQSSIDAGRTDVFLHGMPVIGGLGGSCTSVILNPTESCDFQFAVPAGSWTTGAIYQLKLVTPSGGVFSYPVTQAGSG